FPPWTIWFRGLVGRFGWLDYGYPEWAYVLALAIAVTMTAGALWFVWQRRAALRERAGEASGYIVAAAGLVLAVAVVSYRNRVASGGQFEQARYLLPLLALFALAPALAVRAAGRRAQVAGVLIVLSVIGYSVLAYGLTLARYYG